MRPALDHDGRLATVLRRFPVVLGLHFSQGTGAARSGELPQLAMAPGALTQAAGLTTWPGYDASLPIPQQAALAGGFLGVSVESDRVTRRAWLLAVHEQAVYGALSLVMAQALWGNPVVYLRFAESLAASADSGQLAAIELHTVRYPAGCGGRAGNRAAAFSGRRGRLCLPFGGRLPADRLRGRVVLLGTSAPGLVD